MCECPGVVSLLVHLHPVHVFPLLFLPLHSACLISFHMCDVPPVACSCWRLYHNLIFCLTILCGVGWNDEENLSTLSCCMSTVSPRSPFEYWACPFSSAYNFAFAFSFLITHLRRCCVWLTALPVVAHYVLVNSHIFSQFVFPTQPFCLSNPDSLHQWWVLKLNFSIRLSPFWCFGVFSQYSLKRSDLNWGPLSDLHVTRNPCLLKIDTRLSMIFSVIVKVSASYSY